MNNGNEPEKDSVNILSNNRGNHNTFMLFVPVLMLGTSFLIFLMLIGMLVFFLVRRADFLTFMPGVFTGILELGKWAAIIVLAGLAIKFVFGSAIKDVFAPLVDVLLRNLCRYVKRSHYS
jgi:hypothetical protein